MPDRENPLSSGVVVVRRVDGEWRFLLLRAFQHWDFPKGLVEEGERPLDGAIREVEEETTLSNLEFKWGYDFRETPPYGRFKKIARYYLAESAEGEVDLPVNPELGRPEHEEFCWFTQSEVEQKLSLRVQPILTWALSVLE